jgi:ATP-binding cassette subfamily B protein
MVLDEPTSSMDSRAEYELFKRFRRLARDRTVILISHRLSTLKMTDVIYVLRNKRIVESGTHNELVANGGTYAELFEAQAQAYR